jgi:hypothetical protein
MNLNELLSTRGIDRALIVDDGYDNAPTAADVSGDQGAWANFIADLAIHHDAVEAAFPGYANIPTDDLVNNDAFVQALWNARGRLDEAAWLELFGQYERDVSGDKAFLADLENGLGQLGLAINRAGRGTQIDNGNVPLLFVDLFLGGAQDGAAMDSSIRRVRELLKGREEDPPLVVLMSRSDRLNLNREHFRSETGLLGAMFRVSSKGALIADGGLAHLLTRLAHHREDGRRLAAFLSAWDRGLEAARRSFIDRVRCLDLPDYAQIRDLLVTFEGQPLGSYLLDVFDRVLQFEIEADAGTIAAAREVSKVDLTQYLAPHIAGSPDLQALVYRTVYQNPARLEVLTTINGIHLAFGDLLTPVEAAPGGDLSGQPVLAVMTPACDLVRPGCRQVLMVAGEMRSLGPRDWKYRGETRTPIIVVPGSNGADDRRYWIAWDLRKFEVWSPEEVKKKLDRGGSHRRLIRLRESVAVELQQKMLADIGRVGQVAHMPATFPVDVELQKVSADGTWTVVDLPALMRDGGVCFEGRSADSGPNVRLVISEEACQQITAHIATINDEGVPQDARQALARLKASPAFASMLESGLDITKANASFTPIQPRIQQGDQPLEGAFALIARNPTGEPAARNRRQGIVALVVRDLPIGPTDGGAAISAAPAEAIYSDFSDAADSQQIKEER